jgi:hypothetical protein
MVLDHSLLTFEKTEVIIILSILQMVMKHAGYLTRKVRPSTFQPLRLRPLSGARQPCSDWLDARHLAIVLIHPSRQGF